MTKTYQINYEKNPARNLPPHVKKDEWRPTFQIFRNVTNGRTDQKNLHTNRVVSCLSVQIGLWVVSLSERPGRNDIYGTRTSTVRVPSHAAFLASLGSDGPGSGSGVAEPAVPDSRLLEYRTLDGIDIDMDALD